MKKWSPVLFVCLALGVGGAAVYLFAKPALGASPAAAASFLPPETILLAAVPDLNRTAADFKTTDLYKIWSEPDVQAFLARPLSKLPPHAGLDDALTRADKLGLTNLFVALTALDEETSQPRLVAGFQFKGTSADVDALLAKPKQDFLQSHPAAKADLLNYEGHPMETVTVDESSTLASVYLGNWYLVSNNLALLKATVDRVEHRGPAAAQPALDKDADYNAVLARLPAGYATLIFGRAKALLAKVMDLAEAGGQTVDPKQRAEMEKVRAAGATTGFENGKIRDTIYLHAPGISQENARLGMESLPLTTADTVLYAASVLNIPEKFDLPSAPGGAGAPNGLAIFQGLGRMLKAHNVSYEAFRTAFGNEASLALDWPAGQPQPTVVATLNVRDPAAAGKFVDNFTAALTAEAAWETAQFDGLTFHSVEVPNVPALAPTLTVTPKHLLLGLNLPEVRAAAAREKAPAANFTASEAYKKTADDVSKANTAYAYLDSRTFFERFYGTLKPYAMTAAFLMPQVNEYVDLSKLPEPEVIARHLAPTVLSQTYSPEGCLLESVGTFTFGQAVAVVSGGAASVASQFAPKKGADDEPDAAPAPTP